MADDAAVFLVDTGEEAGHVDEGEDRDVEGVAEPHEARCLLRGGDIESPGEDGWLIGDDPDGVAVKTSEAHDDVLGELFVHLEELLGVEDVLDHLTHVVGLVRLVGDD